MQPVCPGSCASSGNVKADRHRLLVCTRCPGPIHAGSVLSSCHATTGATLSCSLLWSLTLLQPPIFSHPLPPLPDAPQTRHPLLHVLCHTREYLIRRAMRMRRSFTHITQPPQRDNLAQVLLRHALHGVELLPQRLPLHEVLVHHARSVERDLEPFYAFWFLCWRGERHGCWCWRRRGGWRGGCAS